MLQIIFHAQYDRAWLLSPSTHHKPDILFFNPVHRLAKPGSGRQGIYWLGSGWIAHYCRLPHGLTLRFGNMPVISNCRKLSVFLRFPSGSINSPAGNRGPGRPYPFTSSTADTRRCPRQRAAPAPWPGRRGRPGTCGRSAPGPGPGPGNPTASPGRIQPPDRRRGRSC